MFTNTTLMHKNASLPLLRYDAK